MTLTAISLFSGSGGCSLGFSWAGYKVLLAIDSSRDAVATYRANFPETPCWQRDIRQLSAREILDAVNLEVGQLGFLIGGPPCQGFSSAGAKFWDDPRNELLSHYLRLLKDIRPRWFLMENVEGLLTADKGRYIFELIRGFVEAGYNVRLHKLYSHWYGLPQERKRVFVVGTTDPVDFSFPEATHSETVDLFSQRQSLTLFDAISDLPVAGSTNGDILRYQSPPTNAFQQKMRGDSVYDHWSPSLSAEARKRIEALRPGQTMKDLPEDMQHPSYQRRAFRRVMDGTPTEKRGGAPSGLKRLLDSKPSLTITSAATREFVHPTEDRFLTLRECARIQSFPDDFVFCGNTASVIKMIGNAIPPLIAETLAHHFAQIIQAERVTAKPVQEAKLLGYFLTKASSMSPALANTDSLLQQLTRKPLTREG